MNLENQELIKIRKGEDLDHSSLKKYLLSHLDINENNIEVLQFSGGHANLTYLIKFGESEFVLRRPPLGPIAPSSHDMFREHRVQSSLNTLFPLAPKSILFCDNEDIIGAKFHIIERRKGFVIRKDLRSDLNNSRDYMRSLGFKMIDIISDLHKINPEDVGLGNLGKPEGFVLRQLNGWAERWRQSSDNKVTENKFDNLINHLRLNLPNSQATTILHNDFKLDNVMWDDNDPLKPIAVFDWDMCTRGDPLMDIGHMLNYLD